MFERYGADARQMLVFAHDEARALEHGYVGTEHLLLGAIEQSSGIARGFEALGVSLDGLISKIEEGTDPERRRTKGPRPYTPRAKRVLDLSNSVATRTGHETVRPEHIVLALLDGEDVAVNLIDSVGADPAAAKSVLIELLRSDPIPAMPDEEDADEAADDEAADDEGADDDTAGVESVGDERSGIKGEGTDRDLEREPVAEADGENAAADRVRRLSRRLAGSHTEAAAPRVSRRAAPRPGQAQPACPRCDAPLLETLRWEQHVVPGPDDDPLMVYLLYCTRCGRTLDARSED
jgi:ATP-dependent Clp protease ATP-binding subunit ClpC